MRTNLVFARIEKQINQRELGEKIGLTKQAISLLEHGRMDTKPTTWDAICHALGVPLSEQHKLREVSLPENTSAEKTAN